MEATPPIDGLRLLGPMALHRGGAPIELAHSRKVRALLAYLAVTDRPVRRDQLCRLLWDLPSDPRGELRWCLSKARSAVDEPGHARVIASGESVALDLSGLAVDALDVARSVQQGLASTPAADLATLAALLRRGEFLQGLDVPRSPEFTGWLMAQRRRFRAAEAAVLEHWVRSLAPGSGPALAALERWLAVAPFDRQAHALLLEALASRGRLREGDEHLAAASRQYEAEGQDWGPLALAWRAARARHAQPWPATREAPPALQREPPEATARRASLAVLPFTDRTPGAAGRSELGDGLARDVITRLAKLRSLFVIAEGTMFALADRRVGSDDAGRRLDVDYVASGTLSREAGACRVVLNVQLADRRSGGVVWAEEFALRLQEAFEVLEGVGNRIVTSVASQVEQAERNRAILKNPGSLNAWEAHHRGLWHMVRFNREDNEQARHFFERAVRLDPTFARPQAGLSFTHFQDAFLGWHDREASIGKAYATAAEGLMADDQDPAAHWALGRAMWLMDRQDDAVRELRTSIDLSPNFALGHYTLGFVQMQSGDPQSAIEACDQARALSPMDPLLFAMLAARALGLLRLGRHEEASEWALRSVSRPNAHVHVRAIAMICLALAGRISEAQAIGQAIRRTDAGYGLADFERAFRLGPQATALVRQAARVLDG
ncbi:transcriptional regulator [Ramlibacter aurantiacus]|uniref:transcriptional regulator n=1 Tax=Ramlibacter aurantiacus TaxID=2801330 RepID=UPI00338E52AF